MDQKQIDRIHRVMFALGVAVVCIIVLGTVALPAVLACVYGWRWLCLYPAALAALIARNTWCKGGR